MGIEVPADRLEAEARWDGGWAHYYWMHRHGVPRRLWSASLAACDVTPVIERCRRYVAEDAAEGRALGLLGPTGTGKSWAAGGVMRALERGRFVHVPAVARELLDLDRQAKVFDNLARVSLLV